MVHDRASGIYVPAFLALTSNRTADTYWDLLHKVVQAIGQQISPAEVISDFEVGSINAISTQFPDASTIGCLFRFKQSQATAEDRMPHREAVIGMTRGGGVLDMLTVINSAHIELHGITWVQQTIRSMCIGAGITYSTARWEAFWRYFHRTWIVKYDPSLWNVHGLDNTLVARTNNPLKRFNRELNALFPGHTRPSKSLLEGSRLSPSASLNSSRTYHRAELAEFHVKLSPFQ